MKPKQGYPGLMKPIQGYPGLMKPIQVLYFEC